MNIKLDGRRSSGYALSVISSVGIWSINQNFCTYSQLSNKSTGTMEKIHPKIGVVRNFFCGTFEVNTEFLVAVLLFHYPYSTA